MGFILSLFTVFRLVWLALVYCVLIGFGFVSGWFALILACVGCLDYVYFVRW